MTSRTYGTTGKWKTKIQTAVFTAVLTIIDTNFKKCYNLTN